MSVYDGAHVSTSLASMRSTSRMRSGLVMVIELLVKHQNASSMRSGRFSIESMTTGAWSVVVGSVIGCKAIGHQLCIASDVTPMVRLSRVAGNDAPDLMGDHVQ